MPALQIEAVSGAINLHFMCMLEYKRENYLCIIDNIGPGAISAYVLDYIDQENIDLADFLSIVTRWFYGRSQLTPLSVEIARQGLTERLAPIYRTFDTSYVARIVGSAFEYSNMDKQKIKRRRVVVAPEGTAIHLKK